MGAKDNEASFQCQASNPVDQLTIISLPIATTVYYPSNEPEMTVINGKEWYIEGSDAPTIECQLSNRGNPPATLLLTKSNKTVPETSEDRHAYKTVLETSEDRHAYKTVLETSEDRLTYDISTFGADDDEAEFRCEAWNAPEAMTHPANDSEASFSRSVRVRVAYGPKRLKVDVSRPEAGVHEAKDGETIRLNCSAWFSNPSLFLEWTGPPNGSIFDDYAIVNVICFFVFSLSSQ